MKVSERLFLYSNTMKMISYNEFGPTKGTKQVPEAFHSRAPTQCDLVFV